MTHLNGRSLQIFVVTLIFLIISFISVCLRCFVRLKLVRAFGWDDGLMVFAMALNILFATCGMAGATYGMGQKFESIDLTHIDIALFWWWLGQCSYVLTCCVAKISIAMGVLRLTVKGFYSIILWAVIAVTIVVGLLFWFMLTLQCHPVSHFWHRDRPGHCLPVNTIIDVAYLYSVTATVCDFALSIVPIFLIWSLQMNRRSKIALAGILAMGGIASAAVIVRIPFLHDYKNPEFLYATSQISIWSNVEASLGITAGSLTTLRPLFRFFRDGSYGGSRSGKPSRGTSIPLSRKYGGPSTFSRNDPENHWRSDLDDDGMRGIITTVQTQHSGDSSSQEHLNPERENYFHGVSVHKSFTVTTDRI